MDELVGAGLVFLAVCISLSVLISYVVKRIVPKNLIGIFLVGIFDTLLLMAGWSVWNQGEKTDYERLLLIIQFVVPISILLCGGLFFFYTFFYFWYRRSHPEFSYIRNTFFMAIMGVLLTLLVMGGLGLGERVFSYKGMLCKFAVDKDRCYENKAERLLRKEWCAEIQSDNIRDTCYRRVAYKTQDSQLCSEIDFEPWRDSCKNYLDNLK